jgi:RNA polymerase sigma-70 factor (ECF subfamily)
MGTPEDQAEQIECKSLLGAAVASLPARQREAVEQLALKGRSLVDAAVAIGLTPGALKVNFHRAINNLRQQFGSEKKPSGRAASRRPIRVATATANGLGDFEHTLVKCEM